MNTEQIIKATKVLEGAKVMVANRDFNEFQDAIITAINALALIKEQQEELTFCYDKLTELEKECLGLSLHNITLKKEKKYLEDRLKEEMEIKEDMSVSELKSEIERMRKC